MTHLSKRVLDKKTQAFLSKLFVNSFSNLKPSEVINLNNLIISKTEIEMIKKRIGILWLLGQGVSHDEISKVLNVTRQTVYKMDLEWRVTPKEAKDAISHKLRSSGVDFKLKHLLKELLNIDISARAQLRALHKQP